MRKKEQNHYSCSNNSLICENRDTQQRSTMVSNELQFMLTMLKKLMSSPPLHQRIRGAQRSSDRAPKNGEILSLMVTSIGNVSSLLEYFAFLTTSSFSYYSLSLNPLYVVSVVIVVNFNFFKKDEVRICL